MIRKFAAYISFVGFISLYLPETLALHGPSSPKGGNNGRDRTMMYLATPLVAKKLIHDVRSKGQDNIGARIGVKGRMGSRDMLAMAIPGYGTGEQIFVGGMANFFSAFNAVITLRILLSWFPQSQSVGILQPIFQISDPYLNLFRGIIPPVFGLDLSPLLAFFALNVAMSATASIGCDDVPSEEKLRALRKEGKGSFGIAQR